MNQSAFSRFRLVALLEGYSYLALFITAPLKRVFAMPTPNLVVGMLHGALFILYTLLLIQVATTYKWPFKKIVLAFIAALIPFGTFYAHKKLYPAKEPA